MYLTTTCMHCPQRGAEKVIRSPETGVIHSCLASSGGWDLNPGPQEEQSVLLTTRPSLQPIPQLLKLWVKNLNAHQPQVTSKTRES